MERLAQCCGQFSSAWVLLPSETMVMAGTEITYIERVICNSMISKKTKSRHPAEAEGLLYKLYLQVKYKKL